MTKIDTGSIIPPDGDVKVSPQLQREERLAVEKMINRFIDECREGTNEPLQFNDDWAKLYEKYDQAPFPAEDRIPNAFKDLD